MEGQKTLVNFICDIILTLFPICCIGDALVFSDRIRFGAQTRCSEIDRVFGITLRKCGQECFYRAGCDVINYHRTRQYCQFCKTTSKAPVASSGYVTSRIWSWNKNIGGICENIACNEFYRCDPDIGQCVRSECDTLPDVMNTVLRGTPRPGSSVKLECDYGVHDAIITCDVDGSWSSFSLDCLPDGWFQKSNFKQTYGTLQETTVANRLECTSLCNNTEFCMSVGYNRVSKLCTLSKSSVYDNWPQYPADNAWDLMYRYNAVVHIDRGVRYSHTFSDAVSACAEYGTTLASKNDLYRAMDLGYSLCACGWVSEGNPYVLSRSYVCWNQLGVYSCLSFRSDARYDVYCKPSDDILPDNLLP